MYSLRPSGLISGARELIGPAVSCLGFRVRSIRPEGSRSAHISVLPSRVDWKTYQRPSELHRPQHSAGTGFHPPRISCRGVPLSDSQSDDRRVFGAMMVNRKRLPSGDHRIDDAVPGNFAIIFWSVPSLLTTYRALFQQMAIF